MFLLVLLVFKAIAFDVFLCCIVARFELFELYLRVFSGVCLLACLPFLSLELVLELFDLFLQAQLNCMRRCVLVAFLLDLEPADLVLDKLALFF